MTQRTVHIDKTIIFYPSLYLITAGFTKHFDVALWPDILDNKQKEYRETHVSASSVGAE